MGKHVYCGELLVRLYLMKILMIDDHVLFCEGLIAALAGIRNDYTVDFESDVELIPQRLLQRNDYDLYILDLMMPGMGGLELIRYLNKNNSETPIVVMSSVQDAAIIRQLFQLGVIGYVPKAYSVYQLVDAIEQCKAGNLHIPQDLVAELKLDDDEPVSEEWSELSRTESPKLTKRQVEILSLMGDGLSNQEIADALFISRETVKTHVGQIFKLFNVKNRVNCLRVAKQAGFSLAS